MKDATRKTRTPEIRPDHHGWPPREWARIRLSQAERGLGEILDQHGIARPVRGEQLSARPFTLKGDVFLAYEAVWEAQAALERDDLEAALPAAMAAIELQGIAHSAQYVQPDAARAKAADWQRRIASSKGGSVWKEREEARVESLVLEASHRLREMRKRRTPRRGDRHEVAAWLAKHGKYTYGKSENRIYKLIGPAFKRPG